MRSMIRDEVRAALSSRRAPAEAAVSPERRSGNAEAFRRSSDLVAAAIASRRWGAAEAERLRNELGELDREQFEAVMSVLVPALNRGDIELERGSSLF